MKKIMFDDRFGLTKAVLDGTKTKTRRTITQKDVDYALNQYREEYFNASLDSLSDKECLEGYLLTEKHSYYKVGDIVAIAQPYKSFIKKPRFSMNDIEMSKGLAGWNNKMFVSAHLMPHQIKITDIKVERLHDISEEDCYKEGIIHAKWRQFPKPNSREYIDHDIYTLDIYKESILDPWAPDDPDAWCAKEPQTAFHVLIRKMMGVKAWECNPWVLVYSFNLVK